MPFHFDGNFGVCSRLSGSVRYRNGQIALAIFVDSGVCFFAPGGLWLASRVIELQGRRIRPRRLFFEAWVRRRSGTFSGHGAKRESKAEEGSADKRRQ